MSYVQCPGEGVCNGSVQPEPGHPRLQRAPEGLPRADQGECREETVNTCTWKHTKHPECVSQHTVVVTKLDD